MQRLGEVLRARRSRLGLSQEALAEAVGVSARSILRWEQGQSEPQPEYRRRLAQLFAIDAGDLLTPGPPAGPNSGDEGDVLWHVPFRRNPFFTGREPVLEGLARALIPGVPRLQALTGMGGIGKTQTALEFAHRSAGRYRGIFWLAADTREGCLAGFGGLAPLLDPAGPRSRDFGRSLGAVRQWFRCNAGWLLILDNVDDPALLDEVVPDGRGSTLVTTRAQATGPVGGHIDLPPLSPDESVLFLLRRAKLLPLDQSLDDARGAEPADARKLVTQLDGMPLALDQAGAYIEETGCGLPVYLDRFATQRQALMRRRGRLAREHPESVDATLSLAYRRVERRNPDAGELLEFLCFLSPDAIPEEILTKNPSILGPVLGPAAGEPLRLDDALADLATLSLVRRDAPTDTLTLHRLVQAVVRAALADDAQRRWAGRAVGAVVSVLPPSDPHHFDAFLRFVSQAVAASELASRFQMHTPEAALLFDRLGAHYQLAGDYEASRRLLYRAWRLRKELVGPRHLETAETMLHLAELALVLGRYRRADTLGRWALAVRREQLLPSDPRIGSALGVVGRVCTERGHYAEAEPLLREALEIQIRCHGRQHPEVAETLSGLAEISFMHGRYPETERLLRRALAINEQTLGPDHLATGITVDALGTLYRYWGRNQDAARELQRALAILTEALGGDHPNVMTVLNGLARAMHGLGRTADAEPLARRALEVRERVFGSDHPKLGYSLQVLSEILLARGLDSEAESLARRALAIREQVHGSRHQSVALSLDVLAQVRHRMGDSEEAERLYRRTLTTLEETVGSDHPRVVETLTRYATLLEETGRARDAAAIRKRAEASISRLQHNVRLPDVADIEQIERPTSSRGMNRDRTESRSRR